MECKNNKKRNCGCGSYNLTLIDQKTECNNEPCSEMFSSECIINVGADLCILKNGNELSLKHGDRLYEMLQKMLAYIRDNDSDVPLLKIIEVKENFATIGIKYSEPVNLVYTTGSTTKSAYNVDSDIFIINNLIRNSDYELKAVGATNQKESVTLKFRTK